MCKRYVQNKCGDKMKSFIKVLILLLLISTSIALLFIDNGCNMNEDEINNMNIDERDNISVLIVD